MPFLVVATQWRRAIALASLLFLVGSLLVIPVRASGVSGPAQQNQDRPTPSAAPSGHAELQERRVWTFDAGSGVQVCIDNLFSGARLNGCEQVGPREFRLVVAPEREPINPSPWYAFRLRSSKPCEVTLRLVIATAKARPRAWASRDGRRWAMAPDSQWTGEPGARECTIKVSIVPDPIFIASNQMIGIEELDAWSTRVAMESGVPVRQIGRSAGGRPILAFTLNPEAPPDHVVVIGRQHPPEVSGSMGLMKFIERLQQSDAALADFGKRFRITVIPLVNPDGVHEGQWRCTLGGVDANRDWHEFSQAETRAVRDAILALQREPGARIQLLLDVHATDRDVLYTPAPGSVVEPAGFVEAWLAGVQARFPREQLESTATHNVDQWTFKRWAAEVIKAPGITIEFGSLTPNERIAAKSRVFAEVMAEVLGAQVARRSPPAPRVPGRGEVVKPPADRVPEAPAAAPPATGDRVNEPVGAP
jgi:predicted deacylase